jgi:hypothetical protein
MRSYVFFTMPVPGFRRRRLAGTAAALTMSLVLGLMLASATMAKGPVTHFVSAGGPDACVEFGAEHPGCDGNYSLVAIEYADGSVKGQYTDRFANGSGFHAVIDCLVVDGNDAWVSGVVTQGSFTLPDGEVFDLAGLFFDSRVRDNGTSADDPPDQIGISFLTEEQFPCTNQFDDELLDAPEGQVVVR